MAASKDMVEAEIVLFDHDETLTLVHTNRGFDGEGHGFGFTEEEYLNSDEAIKKFMKETSDLNKKGEQLPEYTFEKLKKIALTPEQLKANYSKNGKHPIVIKHIINKLKKIGKMVGIVSFHDGSNIDRAPQAGKRFILNSVTLSIPGVNWSEIPIVAYMPSDDDQDDFGKNKHIEKILPEMIKLRSELGNIDFSKKENRKKILLVEDSRDNIALARDAGYQTATIVSKDDDNDNRYLQDLILQAHFTVAELEAMQKEIVESNNQAEIDFVDALIKAVTPKLPKVVISDSNIVVTDVVATKEAVAPSFAALAQSSPSLASLASTASHNDSASQEAEVVKSDEQSAKAKAAV